MNNPPVFLYDEIELHYEREFLKVFPCFLIIYYSKEYGYDKIT
jgi:hypothetical protein